MLSHAVTCCHMLSLRSNGKFEVRSDRTGEVIFKDNLGASVSSILKAAAR